MNTIFETLFERLTLVSLMLTLGYLFIQKSLASTELIKIQIDTPSAS